MNYIRSKITRLLDWLGERLDIDWSDQGDSDLDQLPLDERIRNGL